MNIAQKIETGGASSTSTARFRFLANAPLPANDALHIAHWAAALSVKATTHKAIIKAKANMRSRRDVITREFPFSPARYREWF
jgi:hypothetical protein